MPNYILNKSFYLDQHIDCIDDIVIDDELSYLALFEGIKVVGKINIKGNAKCETNIVPINEQIDVDILCLHENIVEDRGIKLKITDYTYQIEDNTIVFTIKCNIEGQEEIKETFDESINPFINIDNPDIELFIKRGRNFISKEDALKLETLLNNDNYEMISTLDTNNQEIIDADEQLSNEITDNLIIENEEIKEEPIYTNDELESIYFKNERKDDNIFKNDTTCIVASFYRISQGDDLTSIMKKCDLTEEDVKNLEFKIGNLIKIKK